MYGEKQGKSTILIVDDTPENLKVLISFLKKFEYGIFVAQNGEDALKRLEQFTPDIILLDVLMPGLDGYETCRLLKENPSTRDIPVIFITALSQTVDKVKGFEAGGVDYITKPFQHEEVLARVGTHLKLQKMQKELHELNAAKDRLFSIIAHDLKNPFTGILSLVDFLVRSVRELEIDEIEDCLNGLSTTCKNAYTLLENLLHWARSQTGRIDWKPRPIGLRGIVLQNVQLLKEKAEEKEVCIDCEIPEQTRAYADEDMVNVVMRNLLTNALKYTHKGGRIRIHSTEKNGHLELCVSDTGIGMTREETEKLFRMDSSLSNVGTNGEKGTGLGLILCKDLIEKNGGSIWVESRIGEGSDFKFTLRKHEDESYEEKP